MRTSPVLDALEEYPIVRIENEKAKLKAAGKTVYDFGTGDPIEPTPPFIREALARSIPEISQYPTVKGIPELRKAAAGYMKRRFGVELDPETEILPTGGSKEAIFLLPLAFLDSRSTRNVVVSPVPGYTLYERGTRFAGGEPYEVALAKENAFAIEPDSLPLPIAARTAIFWTNYPHNPSGALEPRGYNERLAKWAREKDVLVCSDECYVDIWASERPRSLLELGKENVLAFHSCSKRSGMTGYRSGFVAGDKRAIAALAKFRPNVGVASPVWTQKAAAAAWADDAHAEARRKVFNEKRAVVTAFLRDAGLELEGGDATFFLWVRVPGNDEDYARRLLEHGIVTIPGSYFGKGGAGFIRLALVPDVETCKKAVAAWKAAL
ncbi:MAG TPA: succinyldiaminopimelate transaminase [Planctomycetota bacterium]|nr:succinyldiaminopimelate transaminase [Planctomycetota bacterium]